MDEMLATAVASHRRRCRGRVIRGGNFVECEMCKKHAHIVNGKMIEHTKGYRGVREIVPQNF